MSLFLSLLNWVNEICELQGFLFILFYHPLLEYKQIRMKLSLSSPADEISVIGLLEGGEGDICEFNLFQFMLRQ